MRSSTSPFAVSMMMGTSELSRMARQTRSPGTRGQHEVKNDQVEMMLGEFFERLLAVAHGGDPVVLALEIRGHSVANGLFVFDRAGCGGFRCS